MAAVGTMIRNLDSPAADSRSAFINDAERTSRRGLLTLCLFRGFRLARQVVQEQV